MPSAVALGSDHDVAAGPAVAAVAVDEVVVDCVTGAVVEDEDVELEVLLEDLWLLPPHAAIATLAATAAITVVARHSPIPVILRPFPQLTAQAFRLTGNLQHRRRDVAQLAARDHGPPEPTFLTGCLSGLPATDETNNATDWIWDLLNVDPNAGIPPPPLVTCVTTAASLGFS